MPNYPLCIDCNKQTGNYKAKRCSECYYKQHRKPLNACLECGGTVKDRRHVRCINCKGIPRRVQKRCLICDRPVTVGPLCRSCGAKARGPEAYGHRSKGKAKFRTMSAGYVKEHRPDHPRADSRGYVYEHILVAEKELRRSITKGEDVHHVNGAKADNRAENLLVLDADVHQRYHRGMGIFTLLPQLSVSAQEEVLALIHARRLV